ncbi:MAG: PAS domain S-box protein [Steroidobacteraceae bacterium]
MASHPAFITRPRATEISGEQGEQLFNTLLDNLDGMVYRCRDDGEWTMEFVSDGCTRLTGYQPSDLLFNNRISYEAITHPEDRERVRSIIRTAITARQRYELEYRIVDAVGYERWVLERGAAVLDRSGRVLALEGIISDITRLKRAEQSAREAEHRYRSLFDNALEGIFRTTVDGRYIDANPALARIYGYESPDELMNGLRDIRKQLYVDPQRRAEFMYQIQTYGLVSHFESEVYRKDGQVIWISENARVILNEQGQVQCYEGTVEDITEQKHYQQSLIEASEAASAANKAKSAFLANVSHEIRTPMNGIIGMTGLLLDTKMERTQRDYVETIRSSADSLADGNQRHSGFLQDRSRQAGYRLHRHGSAWQCRGHRQHDGLPGGGEESGIDRQHHPEVPNRVIGDPQRIRQCLINLVGNAIKFTRTGEIVLDGLHDR